MNVNMGICGLLIQTSEKKVHLLQIKVTLIPAEIGFGKSQEMELPKRREMARERKTKQRQGQWAGTNKAGVGNNEENDRIKQKSKTSRREEQEKNE